MDFKNFARFGLSVLVLGAAASGSWVYADDQSTPGAAPPKVEKINVDNLKQKYWAKGDENEMRVIQNRLYSKAGKFEFGLLAGWLSNDPFLTTKAYGAKLGYYFSEYFGINAIGWKASATDSSAADFLKTSQGVNADTNNPSAFYGGELAWIPIYGKLSLLGKLIVYYDLHLTGGAGLTKTLTGNEFTPNIGIGQEFYLNHFFALSIDYKAMFYGEDVPNNNISSTNTAAIAGHRSVTTSAVLLGINFLFD